MKVRGFALIFLCTALLCGCGVQQEDTYVQLESPGYEEEMSGEDITPDSEADTGTAAVVDGDTEGMPEQENIPETEAETEAEPEAEPETEPVGPVIETVDGCTYADGVLIVNKSYTVPENYGSGITTETQTAFDSMQAAAAQEGITLFICSGFRSYSYQNTLYTNYVARDGQTAADTYSARPGHSEHQTGLALDINSTDGSMATSPEGLWLAEHCAEYGFVIRYPAGKEHITGYMYEPWHIRYLGIDLAAELTEKGLTLEEYFGLTSVYPEE
ncbi:MAG: M15 family metallopeptidase [Oscillospiraceae bacterium]|nr:M15 family metallopeptidase [Oscillospiraceae bacterium]